jgi:hypothetical protein
MHRALDVRSTPAKNILLSAFDFSPKKIIYEYCFADIDIDTVTITFRDSRGPVSFTISIYFVIDSFQFNIESIALIL